MTREGLSTNSRHNSAGRIQSWEDVHMNPNADLLMANRNSSNYPILTPTRISFARAFGEVEYAAMVFDVVLVTVVCSGTL